MQGETIVLSEHPQSKTGTMYIKRTVRVQLCMYNVLIGHP